MTMVHKLRRQSNLVKVAGALIVVALVASKFAATLQAKEPPVHYNHAGIMPPGAIGSQQLMRGGPLPGYFQPVEIKAPQGAMISIAVVGQFDDPMPAPLKAGMLIGSVYRLRITNIPQQEGLEVYPTIEVIDRIYPPMGQQYRFPILIELAQDELEMALDGKFVTRVVYLEEPLAALPVAQKADDQVCFEAAEGENPLEVADSLGRPLAILRMGGRLPDPSGPDDTFMYGSPPLVLWKAKPRGNPLNEALEPMAARPSLKLKSAAATPLGGTPTGNASIGAGSTGRKPLIVRGPVAP